LARALCDHELAEIGRLHGGGDDQRLGTRAEPRDTWRVKAKTEYAKTEDGVNIAYQVLGEGPLDLVWAPGSGSTICTQ
jgi:hypothetical protein